MYIFHSVYENIAVSKLIFVLACLRVYKIKRFNSILVDKKIEGISKC